MGVHRCTASRGWGGGGVSSFFPVSWPTVVAAQAVRVERKPFDLSGLLGTS